MGAFEDAFARVDALARGDAVLRGRLEAIAGLAVRLIERCDNASVALLLEGRSATVAVTDHVALEVDLLQYRTREGPCLDAVAGDGRVIRVDLLANTSAYCRLAPGALDAGVNSVLSVPLVDGAAVIGSLNLYSSEGDAFDDASEASAIPFAEAAAAAIVDGGVLSAATDLLAGVVLAMEEESVVNQAIGLLMHRWGCSGEAARTMLDGRARAEGMPIVVAAQAVLDEPPAGPAGTTSAA